MLVYSYIYLSVLFTCFVACKADVKKKMEEHGIVPDVLDTAPEETLSVEYPNKHTVQLGNELKPADVKDEPKVELKTDPNTFYTLLMVDPDAPSRAAPTLGEVRHWLVGNIKGSDLKSGDYITEYAGSGPPKGTGLHRYIFLLYKQDGKITFDEPKTAINSAEHRLKFSTKKFVEKYKLGVPVAGNFFQAQWDEYVEIRKKNVKN